MKKVLLGITSLVLGGIGIILFTTLFFNQFIIPIFPLVVAIFVFYVTKTQRELVKTETTPISRITEGVVKIQGAVSAATTLETPFFKAQCIGYSYEKAEIDYRDEDGREYTVSAIKKDDFQDFYIKDKTAQIKVATSHLNLSFLKAQTKTIHKTKHIERVLKNGDVITILGKAVKTGYHQFELQENGKNPMVISTPASESRSQKGLKAIKYLLPYCILMYLTVNYFLFFAPIKMHLEKNTAFILFSFFGMPILAVILGITGSKLNGFGKLFFSNLAGICFGVSILTFPLLGLLFSIETEFYRILCIWASIFIATTLAFVVNYRRLDGMFTKDEK